MRNQIEDSVRDSESDAVRTQKKLMNDSRVERQKPNKGTTGKYVGTVQVGNTSSKHQVEGVLPSTGTT